MKVTKIVQPPIDLTKVSRNLIQALKDIHLGKPIVVVDSLDRENEGDVVFAAEKATYENINFTIKEARGLMCLPAEGSILDRLEIPMMVTNNTDKLATPFTVSIDASQDIETGVSVSDRLKTIQLLVDENSKPTDLSRPGHLFPLRPRKGGLRERQGHTEASVTLMQMAGVTPVAVIAEIMNDDGTMARMPDLEKFAEKFKLTIVTIDEIIEALDEAKDAVSDIAASFAVLPEEFHQAAAE